jgi:hypothetical protein
MLIYMSVADIEEYDSTQNFYMLFEFFRLPPPFFLAYTYTLRFNYSYSVFVMFDYVLHDRPRTVSSHIEVSVLLVVLCYPC